MDDLSGIKKDNATMAENAKISDGRSTPAQNELVLCLEQKILELQGELELVRNLANLSLTLSVPDINQQNPNTQNQAPPQNTQNQNPPPNPPAPHQYPTPPQNLNPQPVPTPKQHHHHPTQYPQTTTYHTSQNAPQPTPDHQNSNNYHPYAQIPGVHPSNPIYVETLPHTPQQTLCIP
ncbi:PREDICTED: extensin-like [Nicotiana attenuata]|uniref:extensin-like n=1 Tax=Nicotiana attenuata TaxID=49451 RepID=UPI0009058DE6|nr:PREDICTED: extensin-like [Nicotiana attenuata]